MPAKIRGVFSKGQKNDFRDAGVIAEAVRRLSWMRTAIGDIIDLWSCGGHCV
jgi:hypothetical protein